MDPKTVDPTLIHDRLMHAQSPASESFATQTGAIQHRKVHMNGTGVIIASDVHHLPDGRVADPALDAAALGAKKQYRATDMVNHVRDTNARPPQYRNDYELSMPDMPVHVHVDLDAEAGPGRLFPSLAAFLAVEERWYLEPFEEFLVQRFGLRSVNDDIRRVVLDSSCAERGKISRHYVWEMRGVMLANNLNVGNLVKEFELHMMHGAGGMPHAENARWYDPKGKQPYPKFIFDFIYTTYRVFRTEGSRKFGSLRVLLRTLAGMLPAADAAAVDITLEQYQQSSIFYPAYFDDDITVVECHLPPSRRLLNAPALIAHWPPEAFNGTEKHSSDGWFRAGVVQEVDGSIGATCSATEAAPRAISATSIAPSTGGAFRSVTGREASLLAFVPQALNTILCHMPGFAAHCEFVSPHAYRFNARDMSLSIPTTNRYCPARSADQRPQCSGHHHAHNNTSATLYLHEMRVNWHCFSSGHGAALDGEHLQRSYRAEDADTMVDAVEGARAFIEHHQETSSFDACQVFKAILAQ